jgi:hypothetical protein
VLQAHVIDVQYNFSLGLGVCVVCGVLRVRGFAVRAGANRVPCRVGVPRASTAPTQFCLYLYRICVAACNRRKRAAHAR